MRQPPSSSSCINWSQKRTASTRRRSAARSRTTSSRSTWPAARTSIPRPSMRLVTDTFAYCRDHIPQWNTISISGYHIREAGSTAVQEVAFTLANGIAYVQAALDAGLGVDDFAPRLSFFWNGHNNFFEEIAKFRASRRMWAQIMTERFGAKDESQDAALPHADGGSTLTAQQPPRTTSCASGSRRSPRCSAARRASTRTASTRRLGCRRRRRRGWRCARSRSSPMRRASSTPSTRSPARTSSSRSPTRSKRRRGPTSRRSTGWAAPSLPSRPASCRTRSRTPPTSTQRRSTRARRSSSASTSTPRAIAHRAGEFPIDPGAGYRQSERGWRPSGRPRWVADVCAARGTQNLLYPMKEALPAGATLGEVSDVLRAEFGEYRPSR